MGCSGPRLPLEQSALAPTLAARPLRPGLPQKKWDTLRHAGVMFPPEYTPHGVKMLYEGRPVDLTPEQEEVATFYAVMRDTGLCMSSFHFLGWGRWVRVWVKWPLSMLRNMRERACAHVLFLFVGLGGPAC